MLIALQNLDGETAWLDAMAVDSVSQARDKGSVLLGATLVHLQGQHGAFQVKAAPEAVASEVNSAVSVVTAAKAPAILVRFAAGPGEEAYYQARQVAAIFQAHVQGTPTVGRSLLQLHGVQGRIEVEGSPADLASRVNCARTGDRTGAERPLLVQP